MLLAATTQEQFPDAAATIVAAGRRIVQLLEIVALPDVASATERPWRLIRQLEVSEYRAVGGIPDLHDPPEIVGVA
jgi:hypothetical protein